MSEFIDALESTPEGHLFCKKVIKAHFRIESMFGLNAEQARQIVTVANTLDAYPDEQDYWGEGYSLAISKIPICRLTDVEMSKALALRDEFRKRGIK